MLDKRLRGKSAVHSHGPLLAATQYAAPPLIDNHHHHSIQPLSSSHPLLKIESVVPTVGVLQHHHNVRHSRMIRRSHSTVSSAYLRRVADPRSRTVAALTRHSNGTTETAVSASDESEKCTNAFPRIKRTKKDREKYPDRINLDRKGLTAIPLIDEEPQLRLLSLQHNLINVFHVPEIGEEATEEVNGANTYNAAAASTDVVGARAGDNWNGGGGRPATENTLSHNAPLSKATTTIIHRPGLSYSRNRLVQGSGLFSYNSGGLICSSSTSSNTSSNVQTTSSSSTPSILINGIPNYCSRSMINGKSLQSLNINQKLILKKNPYVQSLYQSSLLGNSYQQTQRSNHVMTSKSISDSGICPLTTSESSQADRLSQPNGPVVAPPIPCRYGDTLQNLVFLDLYDNQIDKIGNLDGLKSLTVLLLGKNRIVDIAGIVCLRNSLRVLDLHGNRITNISHKICRLQELKSLNLAGNTLRHIYGGDFAGLQNLRELNLKRNRIKRLGGFEDLQHLERLWLCNNDIHRVEDMSCIAKAINLKEITVENNPVSLAGDCCSFLVSYLPNLAMLSQMHVTEQVKRAAMAWRKSKETTDVNFVSISSEVGQSIRREEVISNARTNWELLRSQPQLTVNSLKYPRPNTETKLIGQTPCKAATQEKVVTPKLEKNKSPSESQDSNDSMKELFQNPIGSSLANETAESFRLPPILEPTTSCHVESHTNSIAKTENTSVEDSLGANVDSTSIFSGTSGSSSSRSRSPSSCRSSGPGSSTSELETDFKVEAEAVTILNADDKLKSAMEKKDGGVQQPPDEEDEGVRVAFPRKNCNSVEKSKMFQSKLEDLKMPTIKISENDLYPTLDSHSNLSVSSSLRPEHSASVACDDAAGNATLRSMRSRGASSRKLLTPAQPATSLTVNRAQTAKLSPSSSGSLLVASNNCSSKAPSPANNTSAGTTANSTLLLANSSAKTHAIDREREQGGDYLIEICGRYLNVYGVGALKFVDKQWNVQKAGDVHTVKFSYINFNSICGILGKIKTRFPNAENYCFRETNITCLGQLNSLAEIQGLQSIVVEAEGNLICTKSWRSYAIFRLSHWGLKQINGQDITEVETAEADRLYGQLPDLVLWSLPESLLAPLLSRLRLEEPCQASRLSAKDWLMQAESSLKCVVGKEALQWRKSPTGNGNNFDESIRVKGQQCFNQMMENACNSVDKLERLETLWPAMLTDMIRTTLIDYSQMDTYVKATLPTTSGLPQ